MLFGAILAAIIFPEFVITTQAFLEALNIHPIWLIFAVVGFTLSTVYTPAVSLSLEGKNLALIKTLPIHPWVIFKAKIFFNLWLTLPAVVLTMLIAFPMFSFTVFDWFVGLAMLVVFAMLLSVFFLYINLWFPRFDYHHEVEVVKQSLAALLAVFGGFGLLGGFLWLALDPLSAFEPTLQMTIILMIETVGLLIAVIHLRKNANRYYQQLSI
jgi:ABC-2 type transport system permease protein